MKKFILVITLIVASGVSLLAQQEKQNAGIKQEEVPTAVRIAFVNDFGKIPDDGSWRVTYYVLSEGERTVAKPIWYTYVKRKKPSKIEIRYTPEGKLESSKGLEKIDPNS